MSIMVKQEELLKNNVLGKGLVEKRNYEASKKNVDSVVRDAYEEYLYIAAGVLPPGQDNKGNIVFDKNNFRNSDPVGNKAIRKVDFEASEFYTKLTEVFQRFTLEEYVFFNGYLNYETDADICEKLHYSDRSALKRYKKSAILKVAMYFNIDVLK